jgi:hypothetical protein
MARAQRIPATRLCNRHAGDEGTAIRVWGSHLGGHPKTEITSGHDTVCSQRQESNGGKKTKKPLTGVVCLLTRGGLIRVRLGMLPHPPHLAFLFAHSTSMR